MNYEKELKSLIDKTIYDHPTIQFEELCRRCYGAFPYLIYKLLSQDQKQLFKTKRLIKSNENRDNLPVENPGNFDWRFDKGTIEFFRKKILPNYTKIALFGVPSLFHQYQDENASIHLFDFNELLLDTFENNKNFHNINIDTYDFQNFKDFDCVIMDPPWYTTYYNSWFKKASLILKEGDIYTSLFQKLLRPKANVERERILHLAERIGKVQILENELNYKTPIFESKVFEYYHIPIKGNWRISDLLKISFAANPIFSHEKFKSTNWYRFKIAGKNIMIKQDPRENRNTEIKVEYPYTDESTLIKSISLRNNNRQKVNFITSENHGLIIKGVIKLKNILNDILWKQMTLTKINEKYSLTQKEKIALDKVLKVIGL